ncbi:HPP family protein [Chitinimonas naiadis]
MRPALPWLRSFLPAPLLVSQGERWLSALGAGLGLLLTELTSRWLLGGHQPWFVAPMGASAVLLFAVPASPLAQPWSAVGGNMVSALIGVACAQWLPYPMLAAPLAAALTIAAMFPLRCLHPPGGAMALTAVIGGPAIHQLGYQFVLWPVAINSLLLVVLAVLFNRFAGRRYPHHPLEHAKPQQTSDAAPSVRLGVTAADVAAALAAHRELLDISQDDLESILLDAEQRAYRRRFGEIRCIDVMSRDLLFLQPDMTLAQAWRHMETHRISMLPVLDADRRLLGMLAWSDFFPATKPAPRTATAPAIDGTVSSLMRPASHSASPEQPVAAWISAFSDGVLHHLPVLADDGTMVGMLTQADLIAAMFRSSLEQT